MEHDEIKANIGILILKCERTAMYSFIVPPITPLHASDEVPVESLQIFEADQCSDRNIIREITNGT